MSMKRFACSALALLLMLGCLDPAAKKSGKERKIRVLLTVGGHPFDEKPFYAIFEAMPDVQWTKIELPREAERLKPGVERDFDVIVMYDMVGDVAPEQRKAFVELLNQGIGIVSLHHNVCSRSDWPEFRKIIGGKYLNAPVTIDGVSYKASDYAPPEPLKVHLVDKEHPITKGVPDFQTMDELYVGAHYLDIVQWGLGADDTGPVEIYPPDGKNQK